MVEKFNSVLQVFLNLQYFCVFVEILMKKTQLNSGKKLMSLSTSLGQQSKIPVIEYIH